MATASRTSCPDTSERKAYLKTAGEHSHVGIRREIIARISMYTISNSYRFHQSVPRSFWRSKRKEREHSELLKNVLLSITRSARSPSWSFCGKAYRPQCWDQLRLQGPWRWLHPRRKSRVSSPAGLGACCSFPRPGSGSSSRNPQPMDPGSRNLHCYVDLVLGLGSLVGNQLPSSACQCQWRTPRLSRHWCLFQAGGLHPHPSALLRGAETDNRPSLSSRALSMPRAYPMAARHQGHHKGQAAQWARPLGWTGQPNHNLTTAQMEWLWRLLQQPSQRGHVFSPSIPSSPFSHSLGWIHQ